MRIAVAILVAAAACGTRAPAPSPDGPRADDRAPDSATRRGKPDGDDPRFPERRQGWKAVDADERAKLTAFARGYMAFLARGTTARRATAALVERFATNALELEPEEDVSSAPGTRYFLRGPGGQAAAFAVAGSRPVEEGLRVVIASVDAPHIRLKQQPFYEDHGLAMLETEIHGDVDLASWLATPLALHIHAARPGAADGPLELAIGDDPDEPVLVVPDLLPHLSRHVQRRKVVDSAERMDAVGATQQRALLAYLQQRGLSAEELAASETALVPANPPVFLGIDRAEIGGHGHEHRAMAYAAVETLAGMDEPHFTSLVIVIGRREAGYRGAAGHAFVRQAITRFASVLSAAGEGADLLTTRRIFARSAALVAHAADAKLSGGMALAPADDDALPTATRRALNAMAGAGADYQISDDRGWGNPVRDISTLDIDAVAVGIPVADRQLPMQRISTLDLYQAHLACKGWFATP